MALKVTCDFDGLDAMNATRVPLDLDGRALLVSVKVETNDGKEFPVVDCCLKDLRRIVAKALGMRLVKEQA